MVSMASAETPTSFRESRCGRPHRVPVLLPAGIGGAGDLLDQSRVRLGGRRADDVGAHVVRGGPNGWLSLAQVRLDYLEEVAEGRDESMTRGGEGLWLSEARRQVPGVAV